jgi:hypothetical protein
VGFVIARKCNYWCRSFPCTYKLPKILEQTLALRFALIYANYLVAPYPARTLIQSDFIDLDVEVIRAMKFATEERGAAS